MVQLYVDAINRPNVIPNVQSAWDTFVAVKCSDAKQAALVTYDALLTSQLTDELPCSNVRIRMRHSDAFDVCQEQFMAEMAGISTNTVERTVGELKESVVSKLKSWLTDNETKTRQSCKDLLEQLKRTHLDPVLQQLRGKEAAKVSFDDVIDGYTRIKDDYYKSAKGAKDVIAAVFFEFHPELMKEKEQYLGLLKQLKDFDDERSRNLAAQAYLDQERQRLEEQQSRLQEENRERKKEVHSIEFDITCLFCKARELATYVVEIDRLIGLLYDPDTRYKKSHAGRRVTQCDFQSKATSTSIAILTFLWMSHCLNYVPVWPFFAP